MLDVPVWKQNLTWTSYSESYILRSVKSRRETAYHYIIMLALSLTFLKIQPAKVLKIAVVDNPLSFDASCPGNPREYPHKPIIARNCSHWPTFLLPILWVCLHSDFCGELRKTYVLCNRARNGRSGWSKVVDFGTSWKHMCDFLLVINSNLGTVLHRFWDTATYSLKLRIFSYPTLIQRRRSGRTVLIFWMTFLSPRWVLRLSVGEDFVILACIILTQFQRVTDGRTTRA